MAYMMQNAERLGATFIFVPEQTVGIFSHRQEPFGRVVRGRGRQESSAGMGCTASLSLGNAGLTSPVSCSAVVLVLQLSTQWSVF